MTTTTDPARPEIGLPLEALLQLPRSGPQDVRRLTYLVGRGDWRGRTLALSALGRLMRTDPELRRRDPLPRVLASRVPGLRRRFPAWGLRGQPVRNIVATSLDDRSWIVRTAAVLALGETGVGAMADLVRPLLRDSHRPVRICAAATLLALKADGLPAPSELVHSAEPAPERIGDTELTLDWLTRLASAHPAVLARWAQHTRESLQDPASWARHLAGELRREPEDARQAEIRRYAQTKETHYNFTKPFTRIDRGQNIRHLLAFLTVAENLRVPEAGRILDLGGGAGWVSELLAKFGYRPVTLDISTALISVGRDRFRRENLPSRFTAADMTALPVRSESMDAVVVVDALHHVPDVPAVFREAYRVLVPGGQFLLAEPGEGHAETEKSREELVDYGVCEREIHLREAVDYGRRAGFDQIRIIPHFVPAVDMSPADFQQAMVTPSERWRVQHNGRPIAFDAFLLQSTLNHPIVVFQKGERPLDSRMPRELRAAIDPKLRRDGRRVSGIVTVRNEGDTRWLPGAEAGRVRLGIQLMTPERKLLDLDFARAPLTADVPAGRSLDLAVEVMLPDDRTPYVLKLDMVDEHVCWFEDVGSKPVYVPIP